MKRVVFAVILLAGMIYFNFYCFQLVTQSKNGVIMRLEELSAVLDENGANEKTAAAAAEFTEFWMDEHHLLCRIVRHELLDQMTSSVSQFYPLAVYKDAAELSAEISRCRMLMEEIWDSERPILRNIL
ncbi:MAG: DUF4363 family protein [Oscillospiraceae bacterium]|nr:DUF4363 family protein [Oscillospiraceae bacterium]MBQ3561453.1 DUF4363 family protein [Oscillospiraceae bacterium]MBQ4118614.1 DUF4363 family protein [Oscillospiraceae bacterium]MBQ6699269.1 DUF4363 family protein [Oscillospiraceae bacterium]MBQ6802168.1 DUF4363 family protein [Oscillospiraceae bacterium]